MSAYVTPTKQSATTTTTTTKREIGLGEVLDRFLNDEKFHDIKLKGNDGVVIGANRYALAARSTFFQAMLLGKFSESKTGGSSIDIPKYKGDVLKAVVEYIHTDKPNILNTHKRMVINDHHHIKKGDAMVSSPTIIDTNRIQTLIALAAAANFFDLPGLLEKVKEFLLRMLKKYTQISFVVLEVCRQQEPAVPDEIIELAWSQVRSSSKFVGDTNAVESLSMDTLGEILKDKETEMSEFDLFTLLLSWVESDTKKRKPVAKTLLKLIQLEGISPDHLSSVVEPSGLASTEQLCKAYKTHLMASKEHVPVTEKGRKWGSLPLWSTNNSNCKSSPDSRLIQSKSVLLQCPIMTAGGVHQWTLERVGREGSFGYMYGVVLTGGFIDPTEFLTDQTGSWGFQMDGDTFCNGLEERQELVDWSLCVGDQVTLTLDLRENQIGSGTLSGRIQKKSGDTVAIGPITNLLKILSKEAPGFIPAVESFDEGGFFMVDFKILESNKAYDLDIGKQGLWETPKKC